MAKHIDQIAEALGADVVGQVPQTGGGAFGAARLAKAIETLQARPAPREKRSEKPMARKDFLDDRDRGEL